eukprot:gene21071-27952_t
MQILKGMDDAVMGLAVGEKRKYRMEAKDAYGEIDPNNIIEIPQQPGTDNLTVGSTVGLSTGDGATVTKITDTTITLDVNHELAGKALTFDIELLSLIAAEKMGKAYFGAGCFWSVELQFQRTPGVVKTAVGYCNGHKPNPTYEEVCTGTTGHAEVVEVAYIMDEVSFSELCDVFWTKHDPTTKDRQGNDRGSQYRSGIYCTTPEQKEEAMKSMEKAQAGFKDPIVTEIDEVKLWTSGEDYHQQYLARGGRYGELEAQSPKKMCNDPIRCYG